MKLRCKKIVALIILQLVCIFVFAGCEDENVIERLKNRYGIDTQLLTNYEIICDISGDTFTGYALHYAVIQLKIEPKEFLQSYSDNKAGFSNSKNSEIENQIDGHTCMEIPIEYCPDWNDNYIWNSISELGSLDNLYTIYFPNDYKLVFFETGH